MIFAVPKMFVGIVERVGEVWAESFTLCPYGIDLLSGMSACIVFWSMAGGLGVT